MHLHPEIPLLALARLVHLGSRLFWAFFVEDGVNDGGVHDRAFAHEQPALGEQTVDLHEQPLSELMDFQQSPKAQDVVSSAMMSASQ